MTLYKWTDKYGCTWGGFQWPLPHDDGQPGEWVPALEGRLVPCEHGYHLCQADDLLWWIKPRLFEAEVAPGTETIRHNNKKPSSKTVARGPVRLLREISSWNATSARLFACDCAERVLPLFEAAYPNDTRPREGIVAARQYANGMATYFELRAAWDAAWEAEDPMGRVGDTGAAAGNAARAAEAAARVAAWDARDAAEAADVAAQAAGANAEAAARADASADASAAWTAAWADASADARADARAAWADARDAWADARDDAETAERTWQAQHLIEMLHV